MSFKSLQVVPTMVMLKYLKTSLFFPSLGRARKFYYCTLKQCVSSYSFSNFVVASIANLQCTIKLLKQVAALKQLTPKDLIDFFDEYIKVGAPRKQALSILIYGGSRSSEYQDDRKELVEPCAVRIDDVLSFKRSSPLYGSFKGGIGFVKL